MIPVVVSYVSDTSRHDERFTRVLRELATVAGTAAREAGLDVTWVNAAAPSASVSSLLADAAGVVVLGGADVDPAMYGQVPDGTNVDSMDAAADEFEGALMADAIARGMALFTVCRGTQLLNVVRGGTLVQDLASELHRNPVVGGPMVEHDVLVHADTRLAGILGAGVHGIRSGHHQAIDRLGDGLVVSAVAPDGVIEAVELPGDAWVVGVQWHPEETSADPAALRALLADFARAARPATV